MLTLLVATSTTLFPGLLRTGVKHDYPIQPVPFTVVHVHDEFWAPRIETNRTVTIPYAFKQCELTGRIANFEHAAETLRGEDPTGKPLPGYPFDDTDVYKVIEGASYCLGAHSDPKMSAYVDGLIAKIAAAQEPDGYLYTARTINPKHPHEWSGAERWVNEEQQSHELYDCGHLYEAAVAHFWATGKRNFLNVAIKNADLLVRTFGPGKRTIWPGHEIVEMGLAKLYRATGNQSYLQLAKFLIDSRGRQGQGGEYWQSQKPVVEQQEAVGHAVRAAYLYSGVADVAALTGDPTYVSAIDRLWENVAGKKLYVTGGIGSVGGGEAFGADDDLPNASAYAETCAAVGNDYWNERLFLLHGQSKYIDVLERTLYNGLLSGVGLDGKSFFYQNPLASNGRYQRSAWFGCACCPGNITRFIASVPGYVYAVRGDELFVNLYMASDAKIRMPKGPTLGVKQETGYPWKGDVKLTLSPAHPSTYRLKLRIPDWARSDATPEGLYRFEARSQPYTIDLNGKQVTPPLQDGYAVLDRRWKAGDTVDLKLPMPVRKLKADPAVEEDHGLVALQRGPVVYCAEGKDNLGGHVQNVLLDDSSIVQADYRSSLLNGVVELSANASGVFQERDGLVRKSIKLNCIPYADWANRGPSEMAVWLADREDAAQPVSSYKPPYALAKVTTSGGTDPQAINDAHIVRKSGQQGDFFHWWPKKGTEEWVEYAFSAQTTFQEADLYWFDDTGVGECRAPLSWKLLYKDVFGHWLPVETSETFGTALDRFNIVHFKPITTTALRLEVQLQPTWSAGIQQWVVK
jgi:DUF1680 family protein